MTYDEALQALDRVQVILRTRDMLKFHYDITQAIEVFKRMKMDLNQCKAEWKPVCQCPRGSLCEFFDMPNEICVYGKER